MRQEDQSYYEARAEVELNAAAASGHPAAVRAHYLMAGFYLDLVHGGPDDSSADKRLAQRTRARRGSDSVPR